MRNEVNRKAFHGPWFHDLYNAPYYCGIFCKCIISINSHSNYFCISCIWPAVGSDDSGHPYRCFQQVEQYQDNYLQGKHKKKILYIFLIIFSRFFSNALQRQVNELASQWVKERVTYRIPRVQKWINIWQKWTIRGKRIKRRSRWKRLLIIGPFHLQ